MDSKTSNTHGMRMRLRDTPRLQMKKIQNEPKVKEKTILATKPTKNKKPQHQCGLCGDTFKKYASLLYHCKLHNGEREFKCRLANCGEEFITTEQLTIHEQTHTAAMHHSNCHKCSFCHKEFSRKSGLMLHMRIHSPAIPEIPIINSDDAVTCTLWFPAVGEGSKEDGDKLRVQSEAANRRSIYSGVKPFCCDVCGKSFLLRLDLQTHMTHCPKKTVICA